MGLIRRCRSVQGLMYSNLQMDLIVYNITRSLIIEANCCQHGINRPLELC